jgi:hypothetical protein
MVPPAWQGFDACQFVTIFLFFPAGYGVGLGLRTGSGQPVGVPHRQVLRAAVAVMDQARKRRATARVEGLLERVEHEVLFSETDTRHPTMRRAKTSITKGDGDEADAVFGSASG